MLGKKVKKDEKIARYLRQSNQFSGSENNTQRIKPNAFLPHKEGEKLKTSVFRVDDLAHHEISDIGESILSPKTKKIYGWAILKASTIFDSGLNFEPDNNPPRHANLIDWPELKEKRKLIAMKLAGLSEPILLPKSLEYTT